MKINWLVRIRNRNFWMAVIPALLLVVQTVPAVFGFSPELGTLGDRLLAAANAVFSLLAVLGIVNDPTTAGLGDSLRAQGYEEPWEDDPEDE